MISPSTKEKMQALEKKMERFKEVANDVKQANNGVLPQQHAEKVHLLKRALEDLKAQPSAI